MKKNTKKLTLWEKVKLKSAIKILKKALEKTNKKEDIEKLKKVCLQCNQDLIFEIGGQELIDEDIILSNNKAIKLIAKEILNYLEEMIKNGEKTK